MIVRDGCDGTVKVVLRLSAADFAVLQHMAILSGQSLDEHFAEVIRAVVECGKDELEELDELARLN